MTGQSSTITKVERTLAESPARLNERLLYDTNGSVSLNGWSAFRDKHVLSPNVRLLVGVLEEWPETGATFFFALLPRTKSAMFNLGRVLYALAHATDSRIGVSCFPRDKVGGGYRPVDNNSTMIEYAGRLGEGVLRVNSWADVTLGTFSTPMTNATNIGADAEYIGADTFKIPTQVTRVWF